MLSVNIQCIILAELSKKRKKKRTFDDKEKWNIVTLVSALRMGPFALVFISMLFTMTSNFAIK